MAGNSASYPFKSWPTDRYWVTIELCQIASKQLYSFLRCSTSNNNNRYFQIFIIVHGSRVFSNPVTYTLIKQSLKLHAKLLLYSVKLASLKDYSLLLWKESNHKFQRICVLKYTDQNSGPKNWKLLHTIKN